MPIPTFDDILQKFARRCVMNIHLKRMGKKPEYLEKVIHLIRQYGCRRVQLVKGYFNQEMIDKAHANGILCNVFWADNPAEADTFLDMGIDVILTNDYYQIARVAAKRKKYKAI